MLELQVMFFCTFFTVEILVLQQTVTFFMMLLKIYMLFNELLSRLR